MAVYHHHAAEQLVPDGFQRLGLVIRPGRLRQHRLWRRGQPHKSWTATPGDIWIRRHFTITGGVPANQQFRLFYDEGCEIYLNGVLAGSTTGYSVNYVTPADDRRRSGGSGERRQRDRRALPSNPREASTLMSAFKPPFRLRSPSPRPQPQCSAAGRSTSRRSQRSARQSACRSAVHCLDGGQRRRGQRQQPGPLHRREARREPRQFGQPPPVVTSTASVHVIVAPTPPTGLTATAVSPYEIDLAWTNTDNSQTALLLERSLDGGATWSALQTLAPNAAAYPDQNLTPATTYMCTASPPETPPARGAPSKTAGATTPDVAPLQASNLTASNVTSSQITLDLAGQLQQRERLPHLPQDRHGGNLYPGCDGSGQPRRRRHGHLHRQRA